MSRRRLAFLPARLISWRSTDSPTANLSQISLVRHGIVVQKAFVDTSLANKAIPFATLRFQPACFQLLKSRRRWRPQRRRAACLDVLKVTADPALKVVNHRSRLTGRNGLESMGLGLLTRIIVGRFKSLAARPLGSGLVEPCVAGVLRTG